MNYGVDSKTRSQIEIDASFTISLVTRHAQPLKAVAWEGRSVETLACGLQLLTEGRPAGVKAFEAPVQPASYFTRRR
jgi:hypothetical protein